MNIKLKLLTLLGLSSACQFNKESREAVQQTPNIIFIMTDDHAFQAISAYGSELSKYAPTPNIDQIANDGVRFNQCLVANSISGPSRASILTGKYSHINGFFSNEKEPFDSSQQTYPKLLQKAGYETAVIGKWHLESRPTGFDHWEVLPQQGDYYNPDFIDENGMHRDTGYVTEIITKKTLQWLRNSRDKQKPFMLMMHHKAPHRNWMPGPNELGIYENTTFPEPATLFDDYSGRGKAEHEQDMSIEKSMYIGSDLKMLDDSIKNKRKDFLRMLPAQRKAWDSIYDPIIEQYNNAHLEGKDLIQWKFQRYMRDYLACVAAVDKSVGEILQYLKESGLEENTLIVYTSDQGFYLGEHGWFDKRFMFKESYRTPLAMKWKGVIEPHSINNDMVSNIDFAETFLEIAGVDIPEDMQGESMFPILKGQTPDDWRKEHYYHYYEYPGWHSVKRHYGISTGKYKLIHFYYDIDEWELFDLQNDPMEMKNVYNDPSYQEIKKDLHKRLEELMEKYQDSDSLANLLLPEKK